jgi:hypothetical protein
MIQVDIGGHPPFPNGSKQFSGHFGILLFLAGFHFRGHFEGLNEVFSIISSTTSMSWSSTSNECKECSPEKLNKERMKRNLKTLRHTRKRLLYVDRRR